MRLKGGVIGVPRHLRADFGFRAHRSPAHRLFDPALGGGSVLDVGGYPMSFARLIAGIVEGTPIAEPATLTAHGVIGPTGVDELASALVTFSSGFTASLTQRHRVRRRHDGRGVRRARQDRPARPLIPGGRRQGTRSEFTVFRDGRDPEHVPILTDLATYAIEAELVLDSLPAIEAPWPAMTHADTLGNMRALDAWRAALRPHPGAVLG